MTNIKIFSHSEIKNIIKNETDILFTTVNYLNELSDTNNIIKTNEKIKIRDKTENKIFNIEYSLILNKSKTKGFHIDHVIKKISIDDFKNKCRIFFEKLEENEKENLQNIISVIIQTDISKILEMTTDTYEMYFVNRIQSEYLSYSDIHLLAIFPEYENNKNILMNLISNRIDINIINYKKETPLILSIMEGNMDFAKLLIENKADINFNNLEGWNALTYAFFSDDYRVYGDNIEFLKLLIINGANINALNIFGKTVLMETARYCYPLNYARAQMFLDYGANVNIQDVHGNTALFYSLDEPNIQMTKLLMNHKADVNIKNINGMTSLMHVADKQEIESMKLLIKNGVNVNAKNNKGKTALMIAVNGFCFETIKLLINNKAVICKKTLEITEKVHGKNSEIYEYVFNYKYIKYDSLCEYDILFIM